jgi:hypothetical protein
VLPRIQHRFESKEVLSLRQQVLLSLFRTGWVAVPFSCLTKGSPRRFMRVSTTFAGVSGSTGCANSRCGQMMGGLMLDTSAPKIASHSKQVRQLLQTERFDQVSIGSKPISSFGILFVSGTAEQDNGQLRNFSVASDPSQKLETVHLWHLDVANDKIGKRICAQVVIFAFPAQIAHRFNSVFDNLQRGLYVRTSHCRFEQERVLRGILHNENLQLMRSSHQEASFAHSKLKRVGIHPTRISASASAQLTRKLLAADAEERQWLVTARNGEGVRHHG